MAKNNTNTFTWGTFAILLIVVIGSALLYNYFATYSGTLAKLEAELALQKATLEEIKEYEATLGETTDVIIHNNLYNYKDALIVEVVQGNSNAENAGEVVGQYLPTQFTYSRSEWTDYFNGDYTLCAKIYHIFNKVVTTDGYDLDYYGYIVRGRWYGRANWFSDSKWHYVNYLFKSANAYEDSFTYVFTGKVTSGESQYNLDTPRNEYTGHLMWGQYEADYITNMYYNGTAGVEQLYEQFLDIAGENAADTIKFTNNDYFTSARGKQVTGDNVKVNLNIAFTNSDYRSQNFFDITSVDNMVSMFGEA